MTARLKNYTTTVPSKRSISEIQELLIEFGAVSVNLDAINGHVIGLRFGFQCGEQVIMFKLPANADRVREYLWNEYQSTTRRGRKSRPDFDNDAENIAWRILRDWVHSQLSIITIGMVQPVQVFLPYAWDGSRTLYDRIMADSNHLLTGGAE